MRQFPRASLRFNIERVPGNSAENFERLELDCCSMSWRSWEMLALIKTSSLLLTQSVCLCAVDGRRWILVAMEEGSMKKYFYSVD